MSTICPPNLENILDLPVMLTVELGSSRKSTRELLGLGLGSVVELDPRAGREVDLYVGQKLVARGQVVIVEESLAIKVTEVIGGNKTETV